MPLPKEEKDRVEEIREFARRFNAASDEENTDEMERLGAIVAAKCRQYNAMVRKRLRIEKKRW
jgi:hypothetical protein